MFIIDEDLANGILEYLADKPYNQVFKMIHGLQKLQRYVPPAAKELAPTNPTNTGEPNE